jgi:RHS repeat-associated protein
VNSSGSVQDHVDYSGFGMVTESTASVGDRTKFQGRWDDLDTGTANYRGRQEFIADGRFMSQDPTGLGPDINPYRFVGNDATNETDPSGYFPDLDTIKVTNKGKTADLSKFGDGKINVKDGPQGVLSVQTGVGLDRKSPGGTAFQKETNWIRIAYKPTNTVTIAKMDFVQFVWFELKQTKCGNETNIGMPITGVNKTGEFTTNAGPAFVSANTAAPIWVVDRADGAKSISYINTYLAGSRDGELVMYDGPGPGQVAKIAKLAAMLSGTAADVTQWKAIAHFDTYLVYNQKPIYKLSWTATSSVGPKTDATPNVYDIVGGKPVTSLDPAQVALLKEAKYKGQTDISL